MWNAEMERFENAAKIQKMEASKAKLTTNLIQIITAMRRHEEMYGRLPTDVVDNRGAKLLSWRVALLPLVGETELYNRFKVDEPWDSANNSKLLTNMPRVYCYYLPENAGNRSFAGYTPFCRLVAKERKLARNNITDNCVIIVEATNLVPWTKPGDIAITKVEFDALAVGTRPEPGGYLGLYNVTTEFVDKLENTKKIYAPFEETDPDR
jgi:hypothetical protein